MSPLYFNEFNYEGHATGSNILLQTMYNMAGARIYGLGVTLGSLKWYETKLKGKVVLCN